MVGDKEDVLTGGPHFNLRFLLPLPTLYLFFALFLFSPQVQMNAMVNHVVKVLGIVSSSKGAPILLLEPCDVGPLPAYLAHKIGLGTADKMKILSDISDGTQRVYARARRQVAASTRRN